jgi:hypothetical protein
MTTWYFGETVTVGTFPSNRYIYRVTISQSIEKFKREKGRDATENDGTPLKDGDDPASYTVGPLGGPMCRLWEFEGKDRPPTDQVAEHLEILLSRWQDIVGPELARVTRPLVFTGPKARRLLVQADGTTRPPWGGWSHLSAVESERRNFTHFRAAINKAIAPQEVDHVDFTIEGNANSGASADA